MPSLADLLRGWHQGAQAVERGDWGCALRLFSDFPEPPARMCFNVGCVHLQAGNPEAALRAFDQAVTKDTCLAVGFFQRGVANFQLDRVQEALSDFQLALAQLRGHATIDYTQLGLCFRLQAWEVLHNVAAAQCRLGLWAEAASTLAEATSKRPEGASDGLDTALEQVQRQAFLQPRSVPGGEVFRPHRRHLEHLEPMDFLGKATVVAPALPGTQLPQSRAADEDPGSAAPRARVTGPHSASPRRSPKTPAGEEAGRDGPRQASGLPNKQARPHLEQADRQVPPGLPAAEGLSPRMEDPGGARHTGAGDPEPLDTVTVQCAFTVALRARRGADLSSLRTLLSQALPRQAQLGQLSFHPASQHGRWVPIPGETALQRAWQEAAGSPGGLQLQCRCCIPPQGAGGRPVLYQVVAQHGYSAQGPEDLDFQQGDVLDVLCEVDQEWLEGHRDGRIGIFPKCFVAPAGSEEAAPGHRC